MMYFFSVHYNFNTMIDQYIVDNELSFDDTKKNWFQLRHEYFTEKLEYDYYKFTDCLR